MEFRWSRVPRVAAPALVLLGGLAAGIAVGHWDTDPKAFLGAAWLAMGVAYGRRTGLVTSFAAAGYLLASSTSAELPPAGMPIEARVRVTSPWRSGPALQGSTSPTLRAGVRLLSWRLLYPRGGENRVSRGGGDLVLEVPASAVAGGLENDRQAGAELKVRGLVRGPTRFDNRRPVVVGAARLVVKSARWVETERPPGAFSAALHRVRRAVDRRLPPTAEAREPGLALARALTLGDGQGLSTETWRALRQAGLAHLVAVSGFNVAVLVAALWFLAWVVGVKRRGRHVVAALGALAYMAVLGDQPSAARATTSAVLVALALGMGRLPWGPQILGLAGLALLWVDPRWLFDLSFQLTFAATAGLLLGAPRIAAALLARGAPVALAHPLSVGVAAQVATSPWILGGFHSWVGAGLLWNLIAAPWTVVAFLASFAAVALRGWTEPLDRWTAQALDLFAAPMLWLREAAPIWGTFPWGGGPLAAWAGGAALAAGLWSPWSRWIRATLAVGGLSLWVVAGFPRGSQLLTRVVFFDVGQGDATLLQGDAAILIDGGGWSDGDFGGRVLVPALIAEGVGRLDAVLVSHFDRDHCQGLLDTAAWMPVEDVWTGPGWESSACARALRSLARRRAGTLVAGDRLEYGSWGLDILAPDLRDLGTFQLDSNDASVAVLASNAGRRVLLLGDLEAAGEGWLTFRRPEMLPADVLKVGHHGSASSTSEAILDRIRPRLAILSSGRGNAFGHPSPQVLSRLAARRIHTLRTDQVGQVGLSWTSVAGRSRSWRLELPGPVGLEATSGH